MSFATQTPTKPLFDKLLWSRPERKSLAGKLLIIGGNKHDFIETQGCFTAALNAGAGEIKVVLPKSLKKVVGEQDNIEFVDDTPAGSFGKEGLGALKSYVSWADGVLFAGEFSSNSETEQTLSELFRYLEKPAYLRQEAVRIFIRNHDSLPSETVTLELSDDILRDHIQDLALTKALTSTSTAQDVRDIVSLAADSSGTATIFTWNKSIYIHDGESGTQTAVNESFEFNKLAAFTATLYMQFPSKQLEALTTGAYLATNPQ